MRITCLLFAILTICLVPASAANQLHVNFLAIVDAVDDVLCQCIPPTAIAVGDTIIGSYIYDLNAVDIDPNNHVGEYEYSTNPNGIFTHIGAYSFESDSNNVGFYVIVGDSLTSPVTHDSFELVSWINSPDPFWGPGPLQLITITFLDNTENALHSDSLLTNAPDLASWLDARSLIIYGANFDYRIMATIVWIGTAPPPTIVSHLNVTTFNLKQNYPNPFNPCTSIAYTLPEDTDVYLSIYDVTGRLVIVLVNSRRSSGYYSVVWDGRDNLGVRQSSGIYFCRLRTPNGTLTRKMILLE